MKWKNLLLVTMYLFIAIVGKAIFGASDVNFLAYLICILALEILDRIDEVKSRLEGK